MFSDCAKECLAKTCKSFVIELSEIGLIAPSNNLPGIRRPDALECHVCISIDASISVGLKVMVRLNPRTTFIVDESVDVEMMLFQMRSSFCALRTDRTWNACLRPVPRSHRFPIRSPDRRTRSCRRGADRTPWCPGRCRPFENTGRCRESLKGRRSIPPVNHLCRGKRVQAPDGRKKKGRDMMTARMSVLNFPLNRLQVISLVVLKSVHRTTRQTLLASAQG